MINNPQPTPNNFSGNWRDYFAVPDSFGEDKASVEEALDNIVATGPDGIDLLRKAHASALANAAWSSQIAANVKREIGVESPLPSEGKVEFRSDGGLSGLLVYDAGSHINMFSPGIIQIDPGQIRQIAWIEDGKPKRASLTGILVHELFHQADPNFRLDVMASQEKKDELVNFLVVSDTLTVPEKEGVIKAYLKILNEEALNRLNANGIPNNRIGEQLNTATEAAFQYIRNNRPEVIAKIEERTKLSLNGASIRFIDDVESVASRETERMANLEGDATNYTDAFMRKHFPKEPWRSDYANAHLVKRPSEPIVREKGCGEIKLDHYQPESITLAELGTLQQPVIGTDPSPFCKAR